MLVKAKTFGMLQVTTDSWASFYSLLLNVSLHHKHRVWKMLKTTLVLIRSFIYITNGDKS